MLFIQSPSRKTVVSTIDKISIQLYLQQHILPEIYIYHIQYMCQSFIRVIDIFWNRDKHKKITLITENKTAATDQLLNVDKQLM